MLSRDGKALRTLPTDGPIRLLHWWGEHDLLLAGCEDEKVIAVDPHSGNRKWDFVSEEDPAVFRAAKPYWFKTAPGHAGVHGLHSGVYLEGRSQAFVGSACTLEILDRDGNLVKRLPVFWGPGSRFALIDGPKGSIDLLIARQPTDSHAMAVVNNRELDPKQRAFRDVPDGHTNIGGWACMSRKHIINEDLDGDGRREVVSEINGTWNRVTVWSEDGRALHNVQLGPGQRIPADNVRDFDVVDLDGDGKKELLAALSGGLILALDHRCEKIWSRRLTSPPTVMAALGVEGGARVAVGCEDGTLVVLDGGGEVVRSGRFTGRPTCIERVNGTVILATDQGRSAGGAWMTAGRAGGKMDSDQGSVGLNIDTLKEMHTETVLAANGEPRGKIVIGENPAQRRLAVRIVERIEAATGARLPVVCADDVTASGPLLDTHVVALGNMAANPFIRWLYYQWWAIEDLCYPGVGGYTLRTLHNLPGNGKNVVLLGASDEAGLDRAASRFLARVGTDASVSFGWLMEVGQGQAFDSLTRPARGWLDERREDYIRQVSQPHASKAGAGHGMVTEAGRQGYAYHRTGFEVHAKALREAVDAHLKMGEHGVMAHFNVWWLAVIWDLIEESPVFSDEDRLRITRYLLWLMDSHEGAYNRFFS